MDSILIDRPFVTYLSNFLIWIEPSLWWEYLFSKGNMAGDVPSESL